MLCSKCGAKSDDNVLFCGECGAPIGVAQVNKPQSEQQPSAASVKCKGKGLLIGIVAAVVIIISDRLIR